MLHDGRLALALSVALIPLGALLLPARARGAARDCGCSSGIEPLTAEERAALPHVIAVAAMPPAGVTVHVESIQVGWTYAGGVKKRPNARVRILDGAGAPVYGATVSASWSGCFNLGGMSGVTGDLDIDRNGTIDSSETGWAQISSSRTASCPNNQCLFTLTVTGVSSPGNTYSASQNVETTDFSKCNPFLP